MTNSLDALNDDFKDALRSFTDGGVEFLLPDLADAARLEGRG